MKDQAAEIEAIERAEISSPQVLIVEDDFLVASELEQRLKSMGYSVAGVCSDGMTALELAGQKRPDIILMDITIHGRTDGIGTAAMVRDLYKIPVVFVSAHSDRETLKRAASVDPYGYLAKPCNDEELRVTIDMGLYRHGNAVPIRTNGAVATSLPLDAIPLDDNEERGAVAKFLSSLELFQEVRYPDLKEVAAVSRIIKLEEGDRISSEEDLDPPAFLVMQGRLALLKSSYEGKELTVDLIGPRDTFGLLAAVDQMPSAVTIRCQVPTEIVSIGRNRLALLFEKYPDLYKELVRQLSYRLRALQSSACALAHERVEVRIARALCHFLSLADADPVSGEAEVLHTTRQEIADLAGTTLESTVRTMRAMAGRGILKLGRKRYVGIADLTALKEIADGLTEPQAA